MNKKSIDQMLPQAYQALKDYEIAEDIKGKFVILKTNRSHISSFGAAISEGSLLAAIAFFSKNGGAAGNREGILDCIKSLIPDAVNEKNLFDYVTKIGQGREKEAKENILNAAIALKLAMNLYQLVTPEEYEKLKGAKKNDK